jgi:hypothetical protein
MRHAKDMNELFFYSNVPLGISMGTLHTITKKDGYSTYGVKSEQVLTINLNYTFPYSLLNVIVYIIALSLIVNI